MSPHILSYRFALRSSVCCQCWQWQGRCHSSNLCRSYVWRAIQDKHASVILLSSDTPKMMHQYVRKSSVSGNSVSEMQPSLACCPQIRRYVYCDVVRVHDIQQHMDTSGVQSYVINQAKVVFLRHRPQPKQHRAAHGDVCLTCNRLLREGCRFCSLGCKVSTPNPRSVYHI